MAEPIKKNAKDAAKPALMTRMRTYFLTGLLVTAPPALTIYLAVLLVGFIDNKVRYLIPDEYNPEQYLPFAIPGAGVVFVVAHFIFQINKIFHNTVKPLSFHLSTIEVPLFSLL